jgi:VCBS repeat protein
LLIINRLSKKHQIFLYMGGNEMRIKEVSAFLFGSILFIILTIPSIGQVPWDTGSNISSDGRETLAILLGDMDKDGDIDVIAGDQGNTYPSRIYLNDGTGFGWIGSDITADINAVYSGATGDIDRDGDLDYVAGAWNILSDRNRLYLNDGTGTGWTGSDITSDYHATAECALGDVDRDGDLDFIAGNSGSFNRLYLNNGTAAPFSGMSGSDIDIVTGDTQSVALGDVDNDGDLDLVVGRGGAGETNRLVLNNGTSNPFNVVTGSDITSDANVTYNIVLGDVDSDGDLDVIAGNNGERNRLYLNNGTSTPFSGVTGSDIATDTNATVYLALGDLNMDGDLDLVEGNYQQGYRYYLNNGTSAPFNGVTGVDIETTNYNVGSVALGDMDADGDLDFCAGNWNGQDNRLYMNGSIHRSTHFPAQTIISTDVSVPYWVYAADLDNDGDIDALSASNNDNKIAWYENTDGAGTYGPQQIISTDAGGASSVSAVDFDGDGDLDVLSSSENDDKIAWYENTDGAGTFGSQQIISTDAFYPETAIAADVDGDGDLDVLSASMGDDKIAWYENTDGGGTFGPQQIIASTSMAATSVYAADVDGDGDLDVLTASRANGCISWYENTDGLGGFGPEQVIDTVLLSAVSVYAADVDGDGDVDVLSGSSSDGAIYWYENTDGTGTFGSPQIINIDSGRAFPVVKDDEERNSGRNIKSEPDSDKSAAWLIVTNNQVIATDLDGDGDLDVLAGIGVDSIIVWFENTDGAGTFGPQQVIITYENYVHSVFAADVDGDGDSDVLSASEAGGKIAWYENCGGQFALVTTDSAPTILNDGVADDVLKIVFTHNGTTDDRDMELATIELLFEESPGVPLSVADANAIIENLYIYLDDGSDVFEIGSDTLVATVAFLNPAEGFQPVTLSDGDSNFQLSGGSSLTCFVVIETTVDASLYLTVTHFLVTHVTEASSTAEDRDYDIPLAMEYIANVSSGTISLNTSVGEWNLY